MSNYGYIYLIENLLNNKVYVGQTVINIEKRFKEHLYAARNNKNYLLSKAIRKYKEENFSIKVIDTAQTKEQLDSLEIFYIKKYNSFYEDGYNMTKGGSGNSIETRKVISINDLKIFDSARLTAEFYELQESSIIACCNRRPKNNYCGKMSNGDVHIFRWLDEYHENEKFHFDLKYWKDKQNESKSRKVIVIYKDGTVEKYKSVKKAASSINIPKSRAHLIINDKIVINNDGTIITMRFIEDYNVNETIDWTDPKEYKEQKAVILVNTGEIFSSTVDAAEKLGLSYKAIWRVCNGDRKTYGFMPNGEARIFRWLDEYDESEKISLDKEYYKTELYKKKMKKVIRLNDQKIYDSIKEADEDNLGVSFQSISLCCLRKTNSAGTMTDGNLMVWRFLDDYDPNEIVSFKLGTCKKLRCITTGEIFDSVSEAASKYGIKNPSQISSCCKKKMKYKTAGQYNGVRLEWEYFEK